jgi:hypothetical protein
VLADLHALEPHTPVRLLVHEAGYIVVYVACCSFTTDCGEDANIGQAFAPELL